MDSYVCAGFELRWFVAWQLVKVAVEYIATSRASDVASRTHGALRYTISAEYVNPRLGGSNQTMTMVLKDSCTKLNEI